MPKHVSSLSFSVCEQASFHLPVRKTEIRGAPSRVPNTDARPALTAAAAAAEGRSPPPPSPTHGRRTPGQAAAAAPAAVPAVPRQVGPADQEKRHHRRLQGHQPGPGAGHQRQSSADLQQEDAGEIRPQDASGLPQGPQGGGAALAGLPVPTHRAHRGRL